MVDVFDVMSWVITFLAVACAVAYYRQLHQWTDLFKYARIVVQDKNKITLNAPLLEWALWCKALEGDRATNGRIIYRVRGTTIALIKKSLVSPSKDKPNSRTRQSGSSTHSISGGRGAVQGTWKATDETRK